METSSSEHLIRSNSIEGAVVVDFVSPSIVEMSSVELVSLELERLLQTSSKFVLDFEKVRYFSSAMIGELIKFSKKCRLQGGTMVLCSVNRQIREVFRVLSIDALFPTYADSRTALEALTT